MTTASDVARRSTAPFELRGGSVQRLAQPVAPRVATRIARVLQPAALAADAWVSTEVLVRVARDPDTALRPAVAIVTGPLPYDGVVDTGVLVVVELEVARIGVWRAAGVWPVWVPQSAGVLVAQRDATRLVDVDGELQLAGRRGAVVAAADVARLVAVAA